MNVDKVPEVSHSKLYNVVFVYFDKEGYKAMYESICISDLPVNGMPIKVPTDFYFSTLFNNFADYMAKMRGFTYGVFLDVFEASENDSSKVGTKAHSIIFHDSNNDLYKIVNNRRGDESWSRERCINLLSRVLKYIDDSYIL